MSRKEVKKINVAIDTLLDEVNEIDDDYNKERLERIEKLTDIRNKIDDSKKKDHDRVWDKVFKGLGIASSIGGPILLFAVASKYEEDGHIIPKMVQKFIPNRFGDK